MARLARRAATQSPMRWCLIPAASSVGAQLGPRRRCLGHDQPVEHRGLLLAGERRADHRRAVCPREQGRVDGGLAAGQGEAAPGGHIGGAVEQPGGDGRRPRSGASPGTRTPGGTARCRCRASRRGRRPAAPARWARRGRPARPRCRRRVGGRRRAAGRPWAGRAGSRPVSGSPPWPPRSRRLRLPRSAATSIGCPTRTSTSEAGELALVPGQVVEDLRSGGLASGQPPLPAELLVGLPQGDVVAPLGCHPRRLQPGRAATDDEHPPGPRRPA